MTALFSKPKAANPPAPTPPTPIVDQNDPALLEASKRQRRAMMAGGGRSSTILSGGVGSNMGAEYSSDKLG